MYPFSIKYDGCLNIYGQHIGCCSICGIGKCGMKKVENRAYCIGYKRQKLDELYGGAPKAKKTLE